MKSLYLLVVILIGALSIQGQCGFTMFNTLIGPCNDTTNNYQIDGYTEFTNAPASGQLIIEDTYSGIFQSFNAPFTSPTNYLITGLNSNGQSSIMRAYFSADTSCSIQIPYTAPASCICTTTAGTTSVVMSGSSLNSYILCDGDQVNIGSNNDYVIPTGANPGIGYLLYNCLPDPLNNDPMGDPCLVGILTNLPSFSETNLAGSSTGIVGATLSGGAPLPNNTIWFVPMTFNDYIGFSYNPTCVDLGPAIEVTYLNPIELSPIDTISGQVTVTVTGGYEEFFGGDYTITNNGSGTLSSTLVDSSGSDFIISGLNTGDVWDVSVSDSNGCYVSMADTANFVVGISEVLLKLSLYPNPVHEVLNIEFHSTINGSVQILNILGEVAKEVKVSRSSISLDLSELSDGQYVVGVIQSGRPISYARFIKN
ncbi:MAG: hypothetical protein ACI9J3_000826 [Parvicellaceae bacterium]|jgi:hypothetical protein